MTLDQIWDLIQTFDHPDYTYELSAAGEKVRIRVIQEEKSSYNSMMITCHDLATIRDIENVIRTRCDALVHECDIAIAQYELDHSAARIQ